MPLFKSRRMHRYQYLRAAHFTGREARELSKLEKRYPALLQMVASRKAMWASFQRTVKNKGWESEHKIRSEWGARVRRFYEQKRFQIKTDPQTKEKVQVLVNWVVTKNVHGKTTRPSSSPWDWYDAVFRRLPDEMKWDTPRSNRAQVDQGEVKIDKIRTQRWVADLEKTIAKTNDPEAVEQFRQQLKNLRQTMRGS